MQQSKWRETQNYPILYTDTQHNKKSGRAQKKIEAAMTYIKDFLILGFRLIAGFYLIYTAYCVAGPLSHTHGLDMFGRDLVTSHILSQLLALLLAWCGGWIVLGLRTRVVAFISTTLLTSIIVIKGDFWSDHAALQNDVIFFGIISMIALSVVGGGRYSLVSSGWRDLRL